MIGVFDSGVGGVSVVDAIRKLIPNQKILYFADTKFLPYGEKSEAFIRERSFVIADFLKSKGITSLVIACNTATAAAAEFLRNQFKFPIIAVEPAVKPAALNSKTKVIGVIATELTLASSRYQNLIRQYASNLKVITRASNDLVLIVEEGRWFAEPGKQTLQKVVDSFLSENVDSVVLGSTHFSFLQQTLIELSAAALIPYAAAEPTAQQLIRKLEENNLLQEEELDLEIYVSGDSKAFEDKLPVYLNFPARVFSSNI